jgi:formamidopyrimidine-DNA glycosylase
MPELPDITIYIEALERRIVGQILEKIRLSSSFVVRTYDPPIHSAEGQCVIGIRRLGKRIVFALEQDLFMVVHLMIAGRFHWRGLGVKIPGKIGLAAFDFTNGTLILTEASTKKRASIHLVNGEKGLEQFDQSGIEPLTADFEAFKAVLFRENHTLKRALTDPRLFSGIGNAYSDEILHRARLSPLKQTRKLEESEIERLFQATQTTLMKWIDRLRAETGESFPENVTAFHKGMAVHGRFGEPCPVCGSPVQRIVYAENESNYCAQCQTGGKLLADRALSRLFRSDWPKTLHELDKTRIQPEEKSRGPSKV